ncbi:hypothetical protein [Flavobacterium sp. XS2P39]|uniref:hypothetical protein n=1 Tax=Flavobacterium sp. XS2P39 TaxID=3401725 RepID=UPI003AABA2CF
MANKYGPVPGSAETYCAKILKSNFQGNLRDEIVITTKAGYTMWNLNFTLFNSHFVETHGCA